MTGRQQIARDVEEPLLISAAFLIMHKHAERALSPWNLTVTQILTLGILGELKRPVPIGELARLLIQESPSTSTLVDRMSDRGLVRRMNDPKDRRKAPIKLTRKGSRLLNEVRTVMETTTDELFSVLSPTQRTALKNALRDFRAKNIRRLK